MDNSKHLKADTDLIKLCLNNLRSGSYETGLTEMFYKIALNETLNT